MTHGQPVNPVRLNPLEQATGADAGTRDHPTRSTSATYSSSASAPGWLGSGVRRPRRQGTIDKIVRNVTPVDATYPCRRCFSHSATANAVTRPADITPAGQDVQPQTAPLVLLRAGLHVDLVWVEPGPALLLGTQVLRVLHCRRAILSAPTRDMPQVDQVRWPPPRSCEAVRAVSVLPTGAGPTGGRCVPRRRRSATWLPFDNLR